MCHYAEELPEHPVLKSFLQSTSKGRDCSTSGCLSNGGSDGDTLEVQGVLGNGDGRCSEARGGLSALMHKYMGRPLDKSQQISNWERRPLKPDQVKYAGKVCVCAHVCWDSGVCVCVCVCPCVLGQWCVCVCVCLPMCAGTVVCVCVCVCVCPCVLGQWCVCVCLPMWAGTVVCVCVFAHVGWDSGVCVPMWAGTVVCVCVFAHVGWDSGVCVCVCPCGLGQWCVCAHVCWHSGKTTVGFPSF